MPAGRASAKASHGRPASAICSQTRAKLSPRAAPISRYRTTPTVEVSAARTACPMTFSQPAMLSPHSPPMAPIPRALHRKVSDLLPRPGLFPAVAGGALGAERLARRHGGRAAAVTRAGLVVAVGLPHRL